MLKSLFYTCSYLLTAYSIVCLIRVFMTWIPQFEYTAPGRFIAGLCDPFLNWFRRFRFTRVGVVDFSPILALGVLTVAASSFSILATTGHITVGIILAGIISMIWSFFSFLLNILIIFLLIRLIYDLVNRYGYSQFWTMLDRFLNPSISYVSRILGRGKVIPYRIALILTLAVMVAIRVGFEFLLVFIRSFLYTLPF